jgi:hypothetical protein
MKTMPTLICRKHSDTQWECWCPHCNRFHIHSASEAKLTDGFYLWSVKKEDDFPVLKLQMGGRLDRGDWQDIEPCCLIPAKQFRKLEL